MSVLLVAALTLGVGAIALLGLLAIGRGLLHESIIDAPSMPDANATREPASLAPSVYSSAISTD
jgi:hypothetical protein